MSGKTHMIQLDGLRTIAIALVMFGHYTLFVTQIHSLDHYLASLGVNLFFVLSGFLITSILIENKEKANGSNWFILKQFYVRRFLRIFPLYYLVVFAGLLLNIPSARTYTPWLLTYTCNWLFTTKTDNLGFFLHLWSLSVEEQFYIFFPLLFLLINRKYAKVFFIALAALAILSRIALMFLYPGSPEKFGWGAYSFTPCCLDAFGIGALLAFFKFYHPDATRAFLLRKNLGIISLVLLAIAGFLDISYANRVLNIFNVTFCRTLIALSSVWIIGVASFSGFRGKAGRFLENRAVVYLGKISYGLYVYHYILIYLFTRFRIFKSPFLNFGATRILLVLITIAVASLSWFFFEKPINNLKARFPYSGGKKTGIKPAAVLN